MNDTQHGLLVLVCSLAFVGSLFGAMACIGNLVSFDDRNTSKWLKICLCIFAASLCCLYMLLGRFS
jgi:choline-glycine betaine transporter